MAKVISAAVFQNYPESIQQALLAQGFVVESAAAPVAAPAPVPTPAPAGGLSLLADVQEADEEADSGLFANVYVNHGGKRYRLSYMSLDSDFVKFSDKEKTKRNGTRDAVVDAVKQLGIDAAAGKIKFEVELVQQGHSAKLNLLE